MTTTIRKTLSPGTYRISASRSGYNSYSATIRISSSGSVSCVSVSSGSCSSSGTPGMSVSGKSVTIRMKTASSGGCTTDSDCSTGYECFAGACRRITTTGCTPGTKRCSGTRGVQECQSNGTWSRVVNCPSGYHCEGSGRCVRDSISGSCSTTANFSYNVNGKTVTFTDTSTSSGSGCSIRSRSWDLGSGVTSRNATCSRTFSYYNHYYPVVLEVTDSKGIKKTVSKTVKTGSSSGGTTGCTPGTKRCSGNRGVQECQSDRTWSRVVNCPSGYHCSGAGNCVRDSGGGGGTPSYGDWETESRDLAQGADHTIRVSHGDYEMLTMQIKISSSGTVTCKSVTSGTCNSSTPPGIKISGSTVTAYMKEGTSGGPGGGDGVNDPAYLSWIDGKGGLDNITTPDIMELRDSIVGIEDVGFTVVTQQVMQCRDALLGL